MDPLRSQDVHGEELIGEEINEGDQRAAVTSSSIRHGRSPRRFARFRQTRVASLSPTPTLIGFSSGVSTDGIQNQRGTSKSPLRNTAENANERQRRLSNQDRMGYRMRSKSRIRDGSRDTRTTLADVQEGEIQKGQEMKIIGNNSTDLEKGNTKAQISPPPPPVKKPLITRILPYPLPHFLGYRRPTSEINPKHRDVKPYPSIIPILHKLPLAIETIIWTIIGSFVGISIVELVFARPNHFTSSIDIPPHSWAAPIIVGSFGASSVLLYATPSSPLGQPRSFVGGQFVSSVMGVCVTKLYELAGKPIFDLDLTDSSHSIVWLAGATATACALAMMMITGTLHPPGGATAVLCATNAQVQRMGWKIIPVVLLSSIMMLIWNLIWMNLGRRRYPESWYAPAPATGKDGNLSQYLVEWIEKKLKESKPKNANLPQKTNETPSSNTNSDKTQIPDSKTSNQDPWQNETDWQDSIVPTKQIAQPPFSDHEISEPVERPSRWSNAFPRTPSGI